MRQTKADLQANYVLLLQQIDRLYAEGLDDEASEGTKELNRVGNLLHDLHETRFDHELNLWVTT